MTDEHCAKMSARRGVKETLAILKRRRVLVGLTVCAATGAAALSPAIAPPVFTARAQIFIEPAAQGAPDDGWSQGPDGGDAMIEGQIRVIESESVLRRVVASRKLGLDPEFAGRDPVGADPDARALRGLRRAVEVRRAAATSVVEIAAASGDPDKAARLADSIAEAYLLELAEARGEAARLLATALSARLDALRGEARRAEQAVERYRFEHNLVSAASAAFVDTETLVGLRALQRDLDGARAAYEATLDRARDAQERALIGRTQARVIAHAQPPLTQDGPRRALWLGLALVGGLGLGSGLALARDRLDARLFARRQTEIRTGLRVLAVIPRFLPVPFELPGAAARAFFRLRDALRADAEGRPNRVVLVTSCGEGEGKSAVAATLAAAAAAEGERVLIVGGRAGAFALARRPAPDPQPDAEAGAAVEAVGAPLALESAGAARAQGDVLDQLGADARKFDLILLDCGCVTRDRLAYHLAAVSDAIVVVVRAGTTRVEDVEEVVETLGPAAGRIAGLALNEAGRGEC